MAAGVNYNNVWAALGIPVNVIAARNKAGEPEDFHIGGSDASGIVYKVGKDVTNVKVGDEVVMHCGQWNRNCSWVKGGGDPMYSPQLPHLGLRDQLRQFRPVHQGAGPPVHAQAQAHDLGRVGGLHAGRGDRLADAARLGSELGQEGRRGADLGRRGRPGFDGDPDRQGGGATPVAVVSGEDKFDYCMKLGAKGCINRNAFDHWGMLPHWKDNVGYAKWLKGVRSFGAKIWEVLGEKRAPNIVFEHPGETTIPTSIFVCETGGMVVICAGTTGYNATVDLRYLWMRQKRLQGSHFANAEQSNDMNELALSGLLDPCMSRAFTYEELPLAHQLMHENKHPHGNMSVLIGAAGFGLGASAKAPVAIAHPTLPKDNVHTTAVAYPMSVPLPSIAEGEAITIADDGTKVRDLMHRGIISCKPDDTVGTIAKIMVDKEIHAVVVMDQGGRALGVVSQTDMVLARQGRTPDQARSMQAGAIMTPGCASCDADMLLSEAVSLMTARRMHRLVVTEKDQPVGVISMTDVVRKIIGD